MWATTITTAVNLFKEFKFDVKISQTHVQTHILFITIKYFSYITEVHLKPYK